MFLASVVEDIVDTSSDQRASRDILGNDSSGRDEYVITDMWITDNLGPMADEYIITDNGGTLLTAVSPYQHTGMDDAFATYDGIWVDYQRITVREEYTLTDGSTHRDVSVDLLALMLVKSFHDPPPPDTGRDGIGTACEK